jgi:hypothetical protein
MTRYGLGIILPRTSLRCVFRAGAPFSGSQTAYTISNADIGEAANDRFVVVGVVGRGNSRTITSVTIAGVEATTLTKNAISNLPAVGLFARQVTAGTIITIVATFSSSETNACIAFWTVHGPMSLTSFSAQTVLGEDPVSRTITTRKGGVLIGISANTGTAPNHTWTNMNERFDSQLQTSSTASGADALTSGSSLDVSVDGWANLNAVSFAALWAG